MDFRSDFCGSVFEKYHVLPVQVASLEVNTESIQPEAVFFHNLRDFLLLPGNADLLRTDRDSFIKGFAEFRRTGADISDCREAAEMASQFWMTTACQDIRDEGDEIAPMQEKLIEFALSHSNWFLAKMFQRSGADITNESDSALALKMFDFLRNETIFSQSIDELCALTHLIDFDLLGADDQRFPLRMLMWDDYRHWNKEVGWFAEIRDRETDLPIAKADGWGPPFDGTKLEILAEEAVEQRYKPHSNVPTVQRASGCFSDFDFDGERTVLFCNKDFFDFDSTNVTDIFTVLGNGKMLAIWELRKAYFVRYERDHISFSGRSEFERLIPVAASLCYLHNPERRGGDFDSVVRLFGLRTSSLEQARHRDGDRHGRNRRRFESIFKGTCWEQLPEELIGSIVEFLPNPQRHRLRPSKPQA
ncbi:hypothetical protein CBR_g52671 [Chara braunii]|uniref:Uncharacterized protein n=1 Tax=Chara braunii TaxID=69332 RepID=A0A388MAP1_CHABU|nr:hypothetical protein CBR_g52671 [Chara braunii]|eukprot:GBG91637.1 hypothetical protein CBR_g52671 [Chara braunii]